MDESPGGSSPENWFTRMSAKIAFEVRNKKDEELNLIDLTYPYMTSLRQDLN